MFRTAIVVEYLVNGIFLVSANVYDCGRGIVDDEIVPVGINNV